MSTLSVDTINGQTTASKVMIPGHVVQVTALANTTEGSSTSTSYAEVSNDYRPAITPSSSSNKVLASLDNIKLKKGAHSYEITSNNHLTYH